MDPGTEDYPVVVNCLLRGSIRDGLGAKAFPQHLDLYYARGKNSDSFAPVEDAEVYLEDKRGKVLTRFIHTFDTLWETDTPPFLYSGSTYTLCVEIPGREKITASTTIPSDFRVGRIWGNVFLYEPDESFGGMHDNSHSPIYPHHLWIFAHKGGPHAEGETDQDLYEYLLTDNAYADDFNITGRKFSDLDLSGTPGMKYASYWNNIRRWQELKPDLPLHQGFLRIDLPANYINPKTDAEKEEFGPNENQFVLVCGPQECPTENDFMSPSRPDHFDVYSVCNDYDQYLRDVYTRKGRMGHDLTILYSTTNVYSNVTNGLGIVGSYTIRTNTVLK